VRCKSCAASNKSSSGHFIFSEGWEFLGQMSELNSKRRPCDAKLIFSFFF